MFSALLKDIPRGVKIVIGATVALAIFLFLRGHLYYFRNPVYLGGLIVIDPGDSRELPHSLYIEAFKE